MLNKKEAYELIEKVLLHCKYYTMVTLEYKSEGLTRFANSQIHQNVYNSDTTLNISVYHDKKESKVSTNVLTEDSLKEAVKSAEENLMFLPLGEIELPELQEPKEIFADNYDLSLERDFNIASRAALIKSGIETLDEGFIAAGALTLTDSVFAMGNTSGIKRYYAYNSVGFNVVVMHESGASGYREMLADRAGELDVTEEFKNALGRAKLALNPLDMEIGTYTVILEPLAVGDLVNFTNYMGFCAKSYKKGNNCFTGKLGEKVFGENISIRDDFRDENTINMPFDFEGYEKKSLNIIENGVLKELAYDTKSAMEDNVLNTGHSVGYSAMGGMPINLIMESGKDSFEDLIKSTKRGILVSRFNYMNGVDERQGVLTALTRDGLFLVEDGEIKSSLKNLRFTDSIYNIYNNVTGLTMERTKVPGGLGNIYVPAMKIENFHFTSKSS